MRTVVFRAPSGCANKIAPQFQPHRPLTSYLFFMPPDLRPCFPNGIGWACCPAFGGIGRPPPPPRPTCTLCAGVSGSLRVPEALPACTLCAGVSGSLRVPEALPACLAGVALPACTLCAGVSGSLRVPEALPACGVKPIAFLRLLIVSVVPFVSFCKLACLAGVLREPVDLFGVGRCLIVFILSFFALFEVLQCHLGSNHDPAATPPSNFLLFLYSAA
jgi:hypothetical protein